MSHLKVSILETYSMKFKNATEVSDVEMIRIFWMILPPESVNLRLLETPS